jgi:Pyridoxamine 5'-phosphate oxidase
MQVSPEVEAFLKAHRRAFLFVLRKDGSPTGYPMRSQYVNGALYMNTYRKSAKMVNMQRHKLVCCLVTTEDNEPDVGAVAIIGKWEPTLPPEAEPLSETPNQESGERLSASEHAGRRLIEGKRVFFRVIPERVDIIGERAAPLLATLTSRG